MIQKPDGLAWQLLTDSKLYESRIILQKSVLDLLGSSAEKIQNEINECPWLPDEALKSSPKITRGENYLGKPWMVLDYPRVFEKESVFAFRTMVLFGDTVHCTFHISGRFLKLYPCLTDLSTYLEHPELLVCNESNPWVHHINEGSFQPIRKLLSVPAEKHGYIKYGMVIPFEEWNILPEKVCFFFKEISLLLLR